MITYKFVGRDFFPVYDAVPSQVNVTSCLMVEKQDRGLGGFTLAEKTVDPYVKDFRIVDHETVERWDALYDISNWVFMMAFDGERPVGGAAIAVRTEGVDMLGGRDDLAVLWDIRVDEGYKRQGIGQGLFDMAAGWARGNGFAQMKIECQNNNVPACRFYHKQGAVLVAIDEHAYYNEPECRHEVQLIWVLDLT
ncbi:MAG: GNAT family N-acetyltransferase [Clostridiales bacterium]|nr:GNAT family N-acetyltransferase [Clostridiales bacterium]